ncbi:alpha/beta fold hydrolase [Atopobacter phocae]|uniref:alpha/beta fold hydrolase n=1 Tax=Atopobacter phocae TaxID=136492 RepID=UPI000471A8C7|nr:alpha/beta fold hydrolase [Atopobacter phocae]
MIQIEHQMINNIPILEVDKVDNNVQKKPLMILYHGWKNSKESMMNWAVDAAQHNFKVIIPDAVNHGDRHSKAYTPNMFLDCIFQNVKECDEIIKWYRKTNKIDDTKIVVGGQSMGGITASALLVEYDHLSAGVSLMGSPDLIGLTLYFMDKGDESLNQAEDIFYIMEKLMALSLNHQVDTLDGRPFFIWHDEQDQLVPIKYAQSFYETFKNNPALNRTKAVWTNNSGHNVPFRVIQLANRFITHELNIK